MIRINQRGIEKVQELINQWRNMHKDMKGKMSLERVANTMNVSRKTLDDYSLQFRIAK